jgi:undecaprenyl-diphosphatase
LSKVGTQGLVWFVLALVVAVLRRSPWPFALIALGVLAADALAGLAKMLVGEKRPNDTGALITIPHSHSFPSGHTATAFAGATMLSFFAPRGAPAFYVLAAAIAYSRLYVGVHYPLDVVGGAIIGAVTALLLLAIARRRSEQWLQRG